MAIGPDTLLKQLTAEADELEKTIDMGLKIATLHPLYAANGNNVPGHYVTVNLDSAVNSKTQDILISRYVEAGWYRVEFHTDQREGSWVTFFTNQ